MIKLVSFKLSSSTIVILNRISTKFPRRHYFWSDYCYIITCYLIEVLRKASQIKTNKSIELLLTFKTKKYKKKNSYQNNFLKIFLKFLFFFYFCKQNYYNVLIYEYVC